MTERQSLFEFRSAERWPSRITATDIEKVWGPSKATGAGSLGLSARLSSAQRNRGVVERTRPKCDETHAISVWIAGTTFSELHLDGKKRFADIRDRHRFQIARAGESVRAILSNSTGSCLDLYLPNSILLDFVDSELAPTKGSLELLPLRLEHDAEIVGLARRIADEIQTPCIASPLAIDGATLFLSAALIRRWSNKSPRGMRPTSGLAPWQVRRALSVMHASMDANLSLATLSAEVGLSPYHFSRAFKISVGEPPYKHHLKMRLDHASHLIANTTLKIINIAAAVGFDDASHFARMFKRAYGLRPNEFRIVARTSDRT